MYTKSGAHIFLFTNVPKFDSQKLCPRDLSIHCRDNASIATEDLVGSSDSDGCNNSSYRLPSYNSAIQRSHILHSKPSQSRSLTFIHDYNYFSALVNGLGENTVNFGEKDSSLCATSSLLDSSDGLRLKLENITSPMSSATATTCASTMEESTLSSYEISPDSPGELLPSAVIFANRCLVRSYERRSSRDSFSVVSQESTPSSSISSCKTSKSVRQSSSRDQEIKIKLTRMKILIYRQKCARSFNKAMIHYNRLNGIGDGNHYCDYSSTFNELFESNFTRNCQAESTIEVVAPDNPKEKISVDLIFTRINSLFLVYEDSLSHIIDLL